MYQKFFLLSFLVLFGLSSPYLLRFLRPAPAPAVVSESDLAARRLKAQEALEAINDVVASGDYSAARNALKTYQNEFGTLKTNLDKDVHQLDTYGDYATLVSKNIECLEKQKQGDGKITRNSEETAQEFAKAVNAKDREGLLKLLNCSLMEGIPESEMDPTVAQDAVLRLTGETKNDGLVPETMEPRDFKVVGLPFEGFWLIRNSAGATLEIAIYAPQGSVKEQRISEIVWGQRTARGQK